MYVVDGRWWPLLVGCLSWSMLSSVVVMAVGVLDRGGSSMVVVVADGVAVCVHDCG